MSNLVTTRNGSVANKNSNRLTFPNWSSWIDEMFNSDVPSVFTSNFNSGISLPKVNIRETKDAYFVDMAAPGLQKSDFNIDLDNKVLSISTELNDEKNENGNYTRREFGYSSFRRSFAIPETIMEDKIKAKYNDGILSIHLPKKEDAIAKPPRTIKIS